MNDLPPTLIQRRDCHWARDRYRWSASNCGCTRHPVEGALDGCESWEFSRLARRPQDRDPFAHPTVEEVIPSMCTRNEPPAPSSPAQALAMLHASLGYLATCDAAGLPTAVQAEALIGLERAEAQHTAARARILSAFTAQDGYQADT
jgi:hypothetical protein